jgi:arylsulfatase A-like enzyme
VHFFGVHWPNERHAGTREYGSKVPDRYDHEIAFFDAQCGRLLDAIDSRQAPVAVIITADHGESFAFGTRQHGLSLDEGSIHIPLLVRGPGFPATRVASLASAVDLLPTILKLTGTPAPDYLDGVDLAQVLAGTFPQPRTLLSDTFHYNALERIDLDYSAAFDGKNKVIMDLVRGSRFDLDQPTDTPLPDGADDAAFVPLTRTLSGYLEDTGGVLELSD